MIDANVLKRERHGRNNVGKIKSNKKECESANRGTYLFLKHPQTYGRQKIHEKKQYRDCAKRHSNAHQENLVPHFPHNNRNDERRVAKQKKKPCAHMKNKKRIPLSEKLIERTKYPKYQKEEYASFKRPAFPIKYQEPARQVSKTKLQKKKNEKRSNFLPSTIK